MDSLILMTRDDGIAVLTLNRPDVLNSLNLSLLDDLREAIGRVSADKAARALLITGAGRGFCAGADLAARIPVPEGLSRGQGTAHAMERHFNAVIRDLRALDKPILAAVNGVAAGGGVGLALAADIVVAARSASFIQVFAPKLALVPDMGCTWFLPRLVGAARARGLAMLGDRLPADKAAEWGLIWQCVEDDQLMPTALELAGRLAAGPAQAFARIRQGLDRAPMVSLSDQLDWERATQGVLGDHPDAAEGVRAFLEKRAPRFGG